MEHTPHTSEMRNAHTSVGRHEDITWETCAYRRYIIKMDTVELRCGLN